MTFLRRTALLFLLAAMAGHATGQVYPSKPIRMVVPYAAGGTTDMLGRMISTKMAESMGQPVVLENRVGAGGLIAADYVAKGPADGYTILLAPNAIAIFPATYRKLPFDPAKDFIPVTWLIQIDYVLVADPKFAAASVPELVALAKAKPGSISYGVTGLGDQYNLTMEMIKSAARVNMLGVPYKGDTQLTSAILAGEVNIAIISYSAVVSHIQGGRMRLLAAAGGKRLASHPTVPTLSESGLAGVESQGGLGLFVAAKTSRDIVQRIYAEGVKALNAPDILGKMAGLGWTPRGSKPEETAEEFQRDIIRFKRIAEEAKIPMQN